MTDLTPEQLDMARAVEAAKREPTLVKGAALAARLAREGWQPKKRSEDAAREICSKNPLASIAELVRLGIEYGNSLPPKPVRLPVPECLASAMSVGIKGSKIRLTYATEDEAKAAFNEMDRMLGLGGPV